MRKIPKDMTDGSVHIQRDGVATVVRYSNTNEVLVRFDNGYKAKVQAGHLRKGTVKNRMLPTVFGVGFIGGNEYKSCSGLGGVHSKVYQDWINMLSRCYSEDRLSLFPSYDGCTVTKEWFNFQVFAKWYFENYPKDGLDYHLDKDILSKGVKVYSPETCLFIAPFENYQKAHAKETVLTSPDKTNKYIYNISKFCRENNLSQPAINEVTLGRRKSYKGWSLAK